MARYRYFTLLLFLFLVPHNSFAFSFSEYDAEQSRTEAASAKNITPTVSCSNSLKNQKIALVIAEQEHLGPFIIRQSRYSRFYNEINDKLQSLGLRTYSPEEISSQIAEEEVRAIMENDSEAAQNASRRMGADFFIKGLISTRTGTNSVLGIKEVYATFDFTLTDNNGKILAKSSISGESYSDADTVGSLYQVIQENSGNLVASLYNDYCSSATPDSSGRKQETQTAKAASVNANTPEPAKISSTGDSSARQQKTKEVAAAQPKTIIVSAEGLADPNAETYKKDKGLMADALRNDARRQAVEKAVGAYVDSSTLVQNFMLIDDRVLTRSNGLIKQIIKETPPWLGEDGLMHMMIKAEVFLSDVQEALESMSKNERMSLIKESGNPTISVAILIKDARRNSDTPSQRSDVAENILKAEFKGFGYRVWSEEYSRNLKGESAGDKVRKEADFSVLGEVKFEEKKIKLNASGNTLTQHILTSWTVKCMNNHTGEEIYFNNKIPHKKSWETEDAAMGDIGMMIGKEFSGDFFKEHLMQPSTIYQLELTGSTVIPYDTALLLKKEFVGLRPILNVDLRDFKEGKQSIYEIEFAGRQQNFNQILHNSVIKPLNGKLGEGTMRLTSHHGNVVKISFSPADDGKNLNKALSSGLPSSLADAAPERVRRLIANPTVVEEIARVNPHFQNETGSKNSEAPASQQMIQSF